MNNSESNVKLFKPDQDVWKIRQNARDTARKFKDPYFRSEYSSIVKLENTHQSNELEAYLVGYLKCSSSSKLKELIIWQRIGNIVASYNANYKCELKPCFVADDQGKPPKIPDQDQNTAVQSYVACFASDDSFQGFIGNCFHIAALMGIVNTGNIKLLTKLFPIDNVYEENIKFGVYHFRFWCYGEWVDVVVDDFLPTTLSNHLLFCHNDKHQNEFWAALAEKAFAKLWGSYVVTQSGMPEGSLLFLSGGVHNSFNLNMEKSASGSLQAVFMDSKNTRAIQNVDILSSDLIVKIIDIGMKRKFVVDCSFAENFQAENSRDEIISKHVYVITNFQGNGADFKLELDNPHNRKSLGDQNKNAKIWITYKQLKKNISNLGVFNLDPEDEHGTLPPLIREYRKHRSYEDLKKFTNLLSKWKIALSLNIQFRESCEHCFEITKHSRENLRFIIQFVSKFIDCETTTGPNRGHLFLVEAYTLKEFDQAELIVEDNTVLLKIGNYQVNNLERACMRLLFKEPSQTNSRLATVRKLSNDEFKIKLEELKHAKIYLERKRY